MKQCIEEYQVKIVEESRWKICNDNIFIGCVPQILLCLFLSTLSFFNGRQN